MSFDISEIKEALVCVELSDGSRLSLNTGDANATVQQHSRGRVEINLKKTDIFDCGQGVRAAFEKAAPREFPPVDNIGNLTSNRLWHVRLRPINKGAGHRMLTYQSSFGTVFNASSAGVPTELKLIATKTEIDELEEVSDQFEVVEVSLFADNVDGQIEGLLSEFEQLRSVLSPGNFDIGAFDALSNKANLLCSALRGKADDIANTVRQTGELLLGTLTNEKEAK